MPSPPSPASAPPTASLTSAPLTVTLIAICIVVAIATRFGSDWHRLSWLTFAELGSEDHSIAGGFQAIRHGQWWRLVTPIFIHFSLMHILFNMIWLWDLGGIIERRWRSRTLLLLVLVTAVVSNLLQYLVNIDLKNGIHYGNALSGGMSGVVYSLLGYLWIRGRCDPAAGIRLSQQTVVMMLVWLLLCFSGLMGPIGNSAHAAGLVVGMLSGWIAARISTMRPSPE
jgi:GlpG protein